jgi:hypothetical protein
MDAQEDSAVRLASEDLCGCRRLWPATSVTSFTTPTAARQVAAAAYPVHEFPERLARTARPAPSRGAALAVGLSVRAGATGSHDAANSTQRAAPQLDPGAALTLRPLGARQAEGAERARIRAYADGARADAVGLCGGSAAFLARHRRRGASA